MNLQNMNFKILIPIARGLALILFFLPSVCIADEVAGLYAKATSAVKLGNFADAIDCFDRLIQSNVPSAYFSRGLVYYRINEIDKAIADYDQAILRSPIAEAYEARGDAYTVKHEYDRAVADYTQAINRKPNNWQFYRAREKDYLLYTGHIDAGLIDCHTMILLMMNSTNDVTPAAMSEAYYDLGFAYERKGDHERAFLNYSKSIQANSKNEMSYIHRGLLYVWQAEYQNAASDYNEAIRINPLSQGAINRLSWLLATCPDEKFRDGKRALDLETSLCDQTGWKTPVFLDVYSAAAAEVGDFDGAIKWENRAIELGLRDVELKSAENHLKLYQKHKPCRDVSGKGE